MGERRMSATVTPPPGALWQGLHLAAIQAAARVSTRGRDFMIAEAARAGVHPFDIADALRLAPSTVKNIIRKEKSNA